MSNKKQTAVEWLESFMLKPLSQWPDDYWEQAKEMEKQQIIDAFISGEHQQGFQAEAEQYYKETYEDRD